MSAPLRLKRVMESCGITQGVMAAAAKIPRDALNKLVNHGHWPPRVDRAALRARIMAAVKAAGGSHTGLFATDRAPAVAIHAAPHASHKTRRALHELALAAADLAKKKPPQRANAARAIAPTPTTVEDDAMLLRKQTLSPATRQHFQLPRDPFEDPATQEDVYLNSELRYVRESMYQVARHGGFMGVIGESGAGKSTLRMELLDRIEREAQSIIVIEPYVLAMEAQDKVGKTLRATHIAEAMMAAIDPLATIRSSPNARFHQLHESLKNSARAGHSHVVIVEEAHCMPRQTLKHLKRFLELRSGLKRLLSIILLGQPELLQILSEHNPEVREVVQRIEIVTLPALSTDLGAYLKHRFARAGVPLEKVVHAGAIDALREKLTPTRATGTLLYPLAIANALTAAMNRAAEVQLPQVSADVVRGI